MAPAAGGCRLVWGPCLGHCAFRPGLHSRAPACLRTWLDARLLLCLPLQDVRSTTTTFFLLKIPTLKIRMASRKEVFEANLKSECDLWHLLVKEMWAGKKLAEEHKVRDVGPPPW